MTTELIRYASLDGNVIALIGTKGRIYTPMVFIDSPIRKYMVANGDVEQYRKELLQDSKLPVKRAARAMLKAGKRLGITRGAKKFLRAVE